jgi:hypothetical protein
LKRQDRRWTKVKVYDERDRLGEAVLGGTVVVVALVVVGEWLKGESGKPRGNIY